MQQCPSHTATGRDGGAEQTSPASSPPCTALRRRRFQCLRSEHQSTNESVLRTLLPLQSLGELEASVPQPADYVVYKGFRYARPYVHAYQAYCKARWIGLRPCDALAAEFPYLPASYWREAQRTGRLLLNDRPVPTDCVLSGHGVERLTHIVHRHELPVVYTERIPVLYEDAHLLVVDKPASIPVHPGGHYHRNALQQLLRMQRHLERFASPALPCETAECTTFASTAPDDLSAALGAAGACSPVAMSTTVYDASTAAIETPSANALQHAPTAAAAAAAAAAKRTTQPLWILNAEEHRKHEPQVVSPDTSKPETLHVIHRLDKETSGVVLFAKNKDTARRFSIELQKQSTDVGVGKSESSAPLNLRKLYLAQVEGIWSSSDVIEEAPVPEVTSKAATLSMTDTKHLVQALFHSFEEQRRTREQADQVQGAPRPYHANARIVPDADSDLISAPNALTPLKPATTGDQTRTRAHSEAAPLDILGVSRKRARNSDEVQALVQAAVRSPDAWRCLEAVAETRGVHVIRNDKDNASDLVHRATRVPATTTTTTTIPPDANAPNAESGAVTCPALRTLFRVRPGPVACDIDGEAHAVQETSALDVAASDTPIAAGGEAGATPPLQYSAKRDISAGSMEMVASLQQRIIPLKYPWIVCRRRLLYDRRANCTKVDADRGKHAETWFRPLAYDAEQRRTLVACIPVTGRTHQIRVHLESMGYPICGDGLYGGAWSSSPLPFASAHEQAIPEGDPRTTLDALPFQIHGAASNPAVDTAQSLARVESEFSLRDDAQGAANGNTEALDFESTPVDADIAGLAPKAPAPSLVARCREASCTAVTGTSTRACMRQPSSETHHSTASCRVFRIGSLAAEQSPRCAPEDDAASMGCVICPALAAIPNALPECIHLHAFCYGTFIAPLPQWAMVYGPALRRHQDGEGTSELAGSSALSDASP